MGLSSTDPRRSFLRSTRGAAAATIVLAVIAAYINSLGAPYLFDDLPAVVANPTIRELFSWAVLNPPTDGSTTTGRPIVNLSFALDHAIHGDLPGGYRATNIVIHALSALALLGVVRRVLLGPVLAAGANVRTDMFAWAVALLWAVHPLQTESVTCIAQRTESLCGLFFLLAFYGFARGAAGMHAFPGPGAGSTKRWFVAATAACAAGMGTKEIMATAPVLLLLFDRTFFAGTFAQAWRLRRFIHLSLATIWLILAFLVLRSSGARGAAAGFGLGVSVWDYLLTQCEALTIYVRLTFWPDPLVLDYGTGVVRSIAQVWWQGLLILTAAGASAWAVVRRPVAGFLGAWFFVILAPSSSVVPLVAQTIAEHRMYLPLAALIVPMVGLMQRFAAARMSILVGAVAVALGVVTALRNHDYRDALTIWTDTVEKYPENARAHNNLALVLDELGRADEAETHFRRALALDEAYATAHYNWGAALLQRGRLAEARVELETATRLAPEHPSAHVNLGNVLMQLGHTADAVAHYERALAIHPAADVHYNLGVALLDLGRAREAAQRLRQFLESEPRNAEALYRLGLALEQTGRPAEATRWFSQALEADPAHAGAHRRLGLWCARENRLAEAGRHFEAVLEREPEDLDTMANLANVHLLSGRAREAIRLYEAVLRQRPADVQTKENLRLAREAVR